VWHASTGTHGRAECVQPGPAALHDAMSHSSVGLHAIGVLRDEDEDDAAARSDASTPPAATHTMQPFSPSHDAVLHAFPPVHVMSVSWQPTPITHDANLHLFDGVHVLGVCVHCCGASASARAQEREKKSEREREREW
jgi:hypothetical protein